MKKTIEKAVETLENSTKTSDKRVYKYENLLKEWREEFWTEFLSSKANIKPKSPEKRLWTLRLYWDADRNDRLELINRAKANSKSIEFIAWLLENQNLCFEDNSSHLIKHLNRKWIYEDISNRKYSLELFRTDLFLKNFEYSKEVSDKALLTYKSTIDRKFKSVFTWEFVSKCSDYEVRKLEQLSYKAIIELLERDFSEDLTEIKLLIDEIENTKADILSLTIDKLEPIAEDIAYKKEELTKATKDSASELRKEIKKLQDARSKLLKTSMKKLEDKKKAVQKQLLKHKKKVLPLMFPIFCKAFY